jgi:hypothetical protein
LCGETLGEKGDEEEGRAMMGDRDGMRELGREAYMNADGGRRRKLMELVEKVDQERGWDVLWVEVCRRLVM